jgi:hypothetical protein
MTRYYEKNSKELTALDKLRTINGSMHKVNLMLDNPAAKAYEQQQPREQYQQPRPQQRQQPREQYHPQQQEQQRLSEQLNLHQQLREQFEQRKRNRRNRW